MKTYVVGAQGNHFTEIFLAHKTGVKIEGMREHYNFDAKEKKMKKNKHMFWVLGRADSASLHVVDGRQNASNLPN